MIYFELFLAFLQIGAFSFGGGYAAMPLIKGQVVERYHWMTTKDFTDLITISQITPGPIAINAASAGNSPISSSNSCCSNLCRWFRHLTTSTFPEWIPTYESSRAGFIYQSYGLAGIYPFSDWSFCSTCKEDGSCACNVFTRNCGSDYSDG